MLLYQPKTGYRYNSDTLILYDFIHSFNPKGKVLDVGTGCGILGLLLAQESAKITLHGVEKQPLFAKLTLKNAELNGVNISLECSDFLEMNNYEKFDYIVSNPPFYPEGVQKSEDTLLFGARYNLNLPLEPFFKKVSQLLKPHSHFFFCYDPSQLMQISCALERVKLKIVDLRFVHTKREKKASLVLVHVRNGSKSLMNVMSPFISFENADLSNELQLIYERAKTQSVEWVE